MKKIFIAAVIMAIVQFDFIDTVNAVMFVPHDNVIIKFTTYKKNGTKTGCPVARKLFALKANRTNKADNIFKKAISDKKVLLKLHTAQAAQFHALERQYILLNAMLAS